jgi:glycosyltransferase involved in cell wall biosynthesis
MLEEPEKQTNVEKARAQGIEVFICPGKEACCHLMEEADVVVLNWWDHPIVSQFLYELPQRKSRLIAWVHINGCTYPYLPFDFLNAFDRIWFTSAYSYENRLWIPDEHSTIQQKSTVILGNGDFTPKEMKQKESYRLGSRFRIGYVGTLNDSKLHPAFVRYCEAAIQKCPQAEIILVGEADEKLLDEISNSSMSDHFIYRGYTDQVEEEYLSFDVLGYLLNEENFGTTENVILEAMAYGIPVIAYDGGVERAIIYHGEDGMLVQSPEEYAQCIAKLYEDESLRHQIGQAGRQTVCERFDGQQNLAKLAECLESSLQQEKRVHDFKEILGETPFEWFLKFTGPDRNLFESASRKECSDSVKQALKHCKEIYKGESKSSVKHFLKYYKDDRLRMIESSLIESMKAI